MDSIQINGSTINLYLESSEVIMRQLKMDTKNTFININAISFSLLENDFHLKIAKR